MEIYMSTLAHHYNPEIWGEDVHLFKPERFAEGVAKATNKSIAAFFPFGMGPRTCLGFNYAIIEGKIALSMILQRYRFTLSPTYVHHPVHLLSVSKAWYSSHSPAIISMVFKPSSHSAPCFIMSISNFLYVV
jgi:PHYB activation tagged suppressor 1